jgi:hypothetical protein
MLIGRTPSKRRNKHRTTVLSKWKMEHLSHWYLGQMEKWVHDECKKFHKKLALKLSNILAEIRKLLLYH